MIVSPNIIWLKWILAFAGGNMTVEGNESPSTNKAQYNSFKEAIIENCDPLHQKVFGHFQFMARTELIIAGTAMLACLNGLVDTIDHPKLYDALLIGASLFFLAGSTRVLSMEIENSALGLLRDSYFQSASMHIAKDNTERQEYYEESQRIIQKYRKDVKIRSVLSGLARMLLVLAIVTVVFFLRDARSCVGC